GSCLTIAASWIPVRTRPASLGAPTTNRSPDLRMDSSTNFLIVGFSIPRRPVHIAKASCVGRLIVSIGLHTNGALRQPRREPAALRTDEQGVQKHLHLVQQRCFAREAHARSGLEKITLKGSPFFVVVASAHLVADDLDKVPIGYGASANEVSRVRWKPFDRTPIGTERSAHIGAALHIDRCLAEDKCFVSAGSLGLAWKRDLNPESLLEQMEHGAPIE